MSEAPEIVHVEYKSTDAVPARLEGYTRFVCLSDSHGHTYNVPGGPEDILLHSGDLTDTGTLDEFTTTIDWLSALPHKFKIIIAGNHDLTLDDEWYKSDKYSVFHGEREPVDQIKQLLTEPKARDSGIVYLQDEQFAFSDHYGHEWSVYGSPWSPEFFDWAFNYPRKSGANLVSKFPLTDILLTHGPPSNVFDKTLSNDNAGCEALAHHLRLLRPRLSLFGHIHEGHGAAIHSWTPGAALPVYDIDPVSNTPPEPLSLEGKTDSVEHTVFVNAANAPAGPAAVALLTAAEYGGPRFRPIVVDLRWLSVK